MNTTHASTMHGTWSIHNCAPCSPEISRGNDSNALLQRRHAETLDNFRSWLGFDHDHFAKDLPLARLRRRLHASLDHDQARDGELAGFLHLLGGHCCQAVEHFLDL